MKRSVKSAVHTFAFALAGALSAPVLGQAEEVVITAENVDLAGAGRLEYQPDQAAFTAEELAAVEPGGGNVRLSISPDGTPLACEPDDDSASPDFYRKLCGQITQSAHFRLTAGFVLPFSKAMLNVHVSALLPEIEPRHPIVFTRPDKGAKVSLIVVPNRPKPADRCLPYSFDLSAAAEQESCEAYLASAGDETRHCQVTKTEPGGNKAVDCWVATMPAGKASRPEVIFGVRPTYVRTLIRYPAVTIPPERALTNDDGALYAPIGPNDYPPTAMRLGVEGKSKMVIGIDGRGRVVSCRPIESSGLALLDNTACSLLLRRGRFTFNAGKSVPAEELRYAIQSVIWKLG